MADNLFADQDELPVLDDNKDYLTELVGEGKKYKDASALAKAKAAADLAIIQREREAKALRDEMTRLREEVQQRKSIEDFLQEMRTQPAASTREPPAEDVGSELTPEKIEALLDQKLQAREVKTQTEMNMKEVQSTLTKVFGTDYSGKLKAKAQELGLGEGFLNDLASKSPKAFFTVLGIDTKAQSEPSVFTPPSRVSGFQPSTGKVKNYKYYQELKKTMKPEDYWSGKVQNEMLEQAATLGDDFYN